MSHGKTAEARSEDKKVLPTKEESISTSKTTIGEGFSEGSEQPVEAPARTIKHRRSASLGSLISRTKALPRTVLVPSLKWDEQIMERQKHRLSAFAPPFLLTPLKVEDTGELVIDPVSRATGLDVVHPPRSEPQVDESLKASAWSIAVPPLLSPLLEVEKSKYPVFEAALSPRSRSTAVTQPVEAPASCELPKTSAWAKGPLTSLKRVTIVEDFPARNPPSASHHAPPESAISLFGTESDPATPWDPAVRHQRNIDVTHAADEHSNPEYLKSFGTGGTPPPPFPSSTDLSPPVYAPTYPWGMPMSPLSIPVYGLDTPMMPIIPGGLGVMWTPTGWAVQDAAMKHSLRTAEVKTFFGDVRSRRSKSYYKSASSRDSEECWLRSIDAARSCKFFADGHCPHGETCT